MQPQFKQLLSAIALGLAIFCPSWARAAAPNIILMMADDLGYADLSCYGSKETNTPHLDKLASQGMRFTDFYAACGVCSPSRAALLTGRFSLRAGVYSWVHESQNMHLRREEITIAERMKAAGYSTGHVGKWHLGYDLVKDSGPKPTPADQGFDHWMATGNNALPSHKDPINFVRNGKALGLMKGYSSQIVITEALHFLNNVRDKKKPFFLNLWFHEPHNRVAAPETFTKRHQKTKNPAYYGCIENMDYAIGRLLKYLDKYKLTNNTLVIFTSDNGSLMEGSNDPFSGRKTTLWEGGIREPGIFRWPGHIKAGTVNSTPAGLVDILPTLCEVASVEAPQDRTLDGVSLLPLFAGKPIKRHHPLYWFYNPSRPVCVIRDGDWCMIADPSIDLPRVNMFEEAFIGDIKAAKLVNFRLYHLPNDPGQKEDLATAEPERFEAMKKKMTMLHQDVLAEAFDWRDYKGE